MATCTFGVAAIAATTLVVDLAAPIGPATHVGSGSLYGITEKLPADLDRLVAPLRPKMFTNPAADQQQPVGDAIVVAGRLAPLGATVTIRLADWFKGWPYGFTSMTDWFDKLGQTVQRKKASGLTNFYGYEIWNEPNGTWKSTAPLSFNEFWAQTHAQLRKLDPTAKIVGPSMAGYNATWLTDFLTFAKGRDVVPDIVAWHELSGEPLTADLQNYRSLEKRLGIGPLPISINEYSGKGWNEDEGKPGTSAPLIAKFERFGVDTACISYWDVAHAGRLGSLLATDTATNGGWWFYKWYGDMTGVMVTTTAPSPSNTTALDGFANLGSTGASVLFAGVNDGVVRVVVKGFHAAPVFGSDIQAVVERTPWVNRSTVVKATTTVSTSQVRVENDEVTLSVSGANDVDGFRVSLTPVGGAPVGTGGVSGSGGATASAGAGGNSGGAAGGGAGASTGGAGGLVPSGGAPSVSGGAPSSGGSVAMGGQPSEGASGAQTGGAINGGSFQDGGAAPGDQSEGGCSCRFATATNSPVGRAWLLGLAALSFGSALGRRRR